VLDLYCWQRHAPHLQRTPKRLNVAWPGRLNVRCKTKTTNKNGDHMNVAMTAAMTFLADAEERLNNAMDIKRIDVKDESTGEITIIKKESKVEQND